MQDVNLAITALKNATEAVARSNGDRNRLLGDVLHLARLLRSNGVLASALVEMAHDPLELDMQRIEEHERGLLGSADLHVRYLAKCYHGTPIVAWKGVVDARGTWHAHKGRNETFRDLLVRVHFLGGGEDHSPGLTVEDVVLMESPLGLLVSQVENAAGGASWNHEVLSTLRQLLALTPPCKRLIEYRRVCGSRATTRIAARIAQVLAEWESQLGDPACAVRLPDTSGLEHDIPSLATQLEFALSGGRSRRQALVRAKAYFEHFFKREAQDVIDEEELRVKDIKKRDPDKKPNARREHELRRHLNRFLFGEGFFPLTELQVASGLADLILAAEASAARPLIAEIKQAARRSGKAVTRTEVVKAIEDARVEVQAYAGNLKGIPGWESIEPIVVVFHTSDDEVDDLQNDATILINIGDATPSNITPHKKDDSE